MAQEFASQHRTNKHPWRSSPYLYWKIASRTFCDQHYSEVWCKQCIVPISWCAENQTLPNCNKCHPLYWHALREDNTENSDYEPEWDTPDPEDDKGVPDLPTRISNMDESPPQEPNISAENMDEIMGDKSNNGIPDGLGTTDTPPQTPPTQQLCDNTLQCLCKDCEELFIATAN